MNVRIFQPIDQFINQAIKNLYLFVYYFSGLKVVALSIYHKEIVFATPRLSVPYPTKFNLSAPLSD